MTVTDYLNFLQNILFSFPFTILDISFIICLIIFMASEKQREIVKALLILSSVCLSWVIVLYVYQFPSQLVQSFFKTPKGIADGVSSLLLLFGVGGIFALGYKLLLLNADQDLLKKKIPVVNSLIGAITFVVIVSITVTLVLCLPVTSFIKNMVNQSIFLSSLTSVSQSWEAVQQKIIGKENVSTLNFITLTPNNNSHIPISRGSYYVPDITASIEVINHINKIRESQDVHQLKKSEQASQVSSLLALRMATKQRLSRTTIEGSTPFDVLEQFQTTYTHGYFMASKAESTKIAVQGLNQIPTYSSQLLSPNYSTIGVGTVYLKEYGYIITILLLN